MKRLIILSIFATITATGIILTGRGNPLKGESLIPQQELRDIKMKISYEGGDLWRLEASRILIDNNNIATIFNPDLISESRKLSLKAQRGIYEIDTGRAEIKDDVVIKLSDGSIARLNSLTIENGNLRSNDPVRVVKQNITITGKGVEADRSGNLKILKDVKVEIR